jgi:dolichol-phosphate mannosyltransferase
VPDQKQSNASALVVIATYNELENLPRLVAELVDRLPQSKILVIDDNSPDGTGRWCDSAMATYSQLSVIHRPGKLGLGSATRLGLNQALSGEFELVATMDADFSHEPESLITMIQQLKNPENNRIGVVIGSRYVAGGKILGWPLRRRMISKLLNGYARLVLKLPTMDNSGAFRVYRTSALRKIDLSNLRSSGYAYLEEINWQLSRAGVPILELPITFRNRQRGKSKTSVAIGLNVFWQITRMALGLWK